MPSKGKQGNDRWVEEGDARQREGCQVGRRDARKREEGCQVEGGKGMPGRERERNARQEEEGCQAKGRRDAREQKEGCQAGKRRDARQREEGDASSGKAALPAGKAGALAQRGWAACLPRAVGAARCGSLTCSLGTPARSAAARPPLQAPELRLDLAPALLQPGAGEVQGASVKS